LGDWGAMTDTSCLYYRIQTPAAQQPVKNTNIYRAFI
jgi:hypothetical protein